LEECSKINPIHFCKLHFQKDEKVDYSASVAKKRLTDSEDSNPFWFLSHLTLSPPSMSNSEQLTDQLASANLNSATPAAAPALASTSAPTDAQAPSSATATADAQKITPWDVEGGFVDGKQVAIDYDKLIKEFGTKKIDAALLERFEKVTGWKPHPLLRRGTFFSHR